VVGDCQAIHTQFFDPVYQLRDTAHTVKQAVFGMNMKMGEHNTSTARNQKNYNTAVLFEPLVFKAEWLKSDNILKNKLGFLPLKV
jgi:hypothetical protein